MKRPVLLLAVILAANAALTVAAMRRTSTTFDEIVLMAGGARGFNSGMWDIAPEHPPLMQYVYGLPVYLAHPGYPDESNVTPAMRKPMGYRYAYSEHFFFGMGAPTERLVFLGRLPAVLISLILITLVFAFTRKAAGDEAAVLAALLTAFLPDVLAHGGVAYNDVPVAAAVFGAVWMIDSALRRPGIRSGLIAGAAIGLALGVKNSAVGLGPIALALLVAEFFRSRRDAEWRRHIVPAALCTIIGAYAALVIIYRGDFLLKEYQYAVSFTLSQVSDRSAPSYLRGNISANGWWYFFPVAFFYKTSAGLHVLMALAIGAFAIPMRRTGAASRLLASELRAPLIALLVFGFLLLRSNLNIGFRYAMPALPFLMVLTAAGALRAWRMTTPSTRSIRGVMVAAMIWLVVHPVSYYPRFLAYISEYGPGRDENYRVLADSSLDWGQGLIELREFMKEHGIPRIYLSYFGSAWPQAYGVDYAPLASFFALKPGPVPPNAPTPEWVVISATNMTGTYFGNDPYARFRETKPDFVIGHTMYAFRLTPDSTGAQP